MDDSKPGQSQPRDPAEDSQDGESGLVSKLARAHGTLPPEQRWAPSLRDSGEQISNPELDDSFQKLLKQQEVLTTYQGHRHQKPDPATVSLLKKRIEQLQARGAGLSDDTSTDTPAEEVASAIPDSSRCSKCGQVNPGASRFCGKCGAELTKPSDATEQDPLAAPSTAPAPQKKLELPLSVARPAESSFQRGFKVALLVLLFGILALLALSQWSFWRQRWLSNKPKRAVNGLAVTPASETNVAVAASERANSDTVQHQSRAVPAADRPGKAARKTEPKSAPPLVVKQPLPGPLPAPAPLASAAEVPLEEPTINPPTSAPSLNGAEVPGPQSISSSPARVSQLALAPIYKVNPHYPATARNARVQGSVVMRAIIGTDGTIQQLELTKGNPLLVNAAMEAAKKWRYRPTLVDGKPVEVETTITISFKGE